ncbi:MAG: glycoside hydrolase 5 family protein [Massiliimalia sp.]|jgi:endo-1,4-beta-mannosidase
MSEKFLLGCNYWASHAGADMWRYWDADCVKQDLLALKENGIEVLRVFLNWRDFQPVERLYGAEGQARELCLVGDIRPSNPYFLDESMLDHFKDFCTMAKECGFRLIVGLVTGWMSGRLYVPPALYGKNIFHDPLALKLQQMLIKGVISQFREESCIYAWDLGNECNCMGKVASEEEAYSWTAFITNAIRASDPSRKIFSGMHSLQPEGCWTIQDQGELTDELTTHPYPYWVEHCLVDPLTSCRTLMHATAQTQYYATISHKPCLVEEIGGMGPMVADDNHNAMFMRANLFSNWANGATGLLWWCAHDQNMLSAPPYDWNMCERELGMMDANRCPKPMLLEMKKFSQLLKQLDLSLPHRSCDGVCILTQGQDHWGIAYMTYVLAKQANLTIDFTYCEQKLPDSNLYFLPSISGLTMSKVAYDQLKEKVSAGATLYISMDDGFLTEFEEFTGLRVEHSRNAEEQGLFALPSGESVFYRKQHTVQLCATRAEVLAADEKGCPILSRTKYGKGSVMLVNFPLEKMLIDTPDFTDKPYYKIYSDLLNPILEQKDVISENPYIGLTEHQGDEKKIIVLVNYSTDPQPVQLRIKPSLQIDEVLYGNAQVIPPCDATVFTIH